MEHDAEKAEFSHDFSSQVFRAVLGALLLMLAVKMWLDPYYIYIEPSVRSRLFKMIALAVYVVWSRPFAIVVCLLALMFLGAMVYSMFKKPAQNAPTGVMLLVMSLLLPVVVFGDFDKGKSHRPMPQNQQAVESERNSQPSGYQTIESYNAGRLKRYGP